MVNERFWLKFVFLFAFFYRKPKMYLLTWTQEASDWFSICVDYPLSRWPGLCFSSSAMQLQGAFNLCDASSKWRPRAGAAGPLPCPVPHGAHGAEGHAGSSPGVPATCVCVRCGLHCHRLFKN